MAKKEKEEKSPKVADDEMAYKITVDQFIEEKTRNKKLITCTLSSDIGLNGGIPLGSTVLIGGKQKMGKTTFSLQTAANAQMAYGCKVFYYNIEGRFGTLVFKQIRGIDPKNFFVVSPPAIYNAEKQKIGHKKWSAEQWWQEIINNVTNNPQSVHIVDSISNLATEREIADGMGYQGRGDLQKAEAQFFRLCGDLIVPSQVTVILMAHIQANTSGMGASTQIKAGNSVRFQSDIIMFGKWVEKWKPPTEGASPLGHDMHFNVECSAEGPPVADMVIPLRYGYGIDNIKDIGDHAVNFGFIKKGGSWYKIPFAEKDGKFVYEDAMEDEKTIKAQGENQLWRWLSDKPDVCLQLDTMIKERILT